MTEHATSPSIKKARLPDNYSAAKAALRRCARHFSPFTYMEAVVAVDACFRTDECASWPQDEHTIASYARMADDNEFMRLTVRVATLRRKWIAEGTNA